MVDLDRLIAWHLEDDGKHTVVVKEERSLERWCSEEDCHEEHAVETVTVGHTRPVTADDYYALSEHFLRLARGLA